MRNPENVGQLERMLELLHNPIKIDDHTYRVIAHWLDDPDDTSAWGYFARKETADTINNWLFYQVDRLPKKNRGTL